MDASNPIISSDRSTVNQVYAKMVRRKRQDLAYLQELVRTAHREILPQGELLHESEAKQYVAEYKARLPVVDTKKVGELPTEVFQVALPSIPVCGIMDAVGVPLHPPSINNRGGHTHVTRQMGGVPHPPLGLIPIAQKYGIEILDQKHVYTGGTWDGFLSRLAQQMGRTTVPLARTVSAGKKNASDGAIIKLLNKYMPRTGNKNWPGVHTTPEEGILDGIKITAKSSAGAPYWRHKGECLDHIIDTGLPVVLKHIKEGTLNQLWRENPEMFLVEVKNKLDRYEVSKLKEKTRPYVCVPAHWALLFSCLTQGFQEGLQVFSNLDPSTECSNAYGFSSIAGGLTRMVDWMYACPKRRGRVVCYGDDACITFWSQGVLYRVDPDFKQMDGSIDREDARITIEWVLHHLRKDLGVEETPAFWKTVAAVWLDMAIDPYFIVDGKTVYKKKNPHGLMTGVPGTTLFDTVKSVIVWNEMLDQASAGSIDLLNEAQVVEWMKRQGLVVKEGTWSPVALPARDTEGLITDHKFLGVQIMGVYHRHRVIHVPTMPESDALEMMLCQKDNPFEKAVSRTARQRTLYDRMRGLMITMGFSIPRIEETIHAVVNTIPGEIIVMQTQEQTGTKPEHITLQDFEYPDSSGFPSRDFCLDLYSDGEDDKAGWINLFPTLSGFLDEFKREQRVAVRQINLTVQSNDYDVKEVVGCPPPPEANLNDEYKVFEALKPQQVQYSEPNPRPKVVRITERGEIPEKFLPNMAQAVVRWLTSVGGVSQVGTVADKVGASAYQIVVGAAKGGYFTTGDELGDLISLYPLVTPFPTLQDSQREEMEEKRNLIDKTTAARTSALRREIVKTQPELINLDVAGVSNLHPPPHDINTAEDAMAYIHAMASGRFSGFTKWISEVRPNAANPVGVRLYAHSHHTQEVKLLGEAWSSSAKLAKEYICAAILEVNNIPYKKSSFATPNVVPPPPESSWARQVEYATAPKAVPQIVPVHETLDLELFHSIMQQFPGHCPRQVQMLIREVSHKNPDDYRVRIQDLFSRFPPPKVASKRSLLTAEQRTRLNRKTLDRKKRKKIASKLLPTL
nr:RNA-dependent RNA polymerase [Drosophila A virus]